MIIKQLVNKSWSKHYAKRMINVLHNNDKRFLIKLY